MLVNHILTIQQHRLNNDKITLVKFNPWIIIKRGGQGFIPTNITIITQKMIITPEESKSPY